MGNGSRILIASLVLAVIILVGAVSFLAGRMTAPQAPAEPAADALGPMAPIAAGPVSALPLPAAALPAAFQGLWEQDIKACGDPASTTWHRHCRRETRCSLAGGWSRIKNMITHTNL